MRPSRVVCDNAGPTELQIVGAMKKVPPRLPAPSRVACRGRLVPSSSRCTAGTLFQFDAVKDIGCLSRARGCRRRSRERKPLDEYDEQYDCGKMKKVRGLRQADSWGAVADNVFQNTFNSRRQQSMSRGARRHRRSG